MRMGFGVMVEYLDCIQFKQLKSEAARSSQRNALMTVCIQTYVRPFTSVCLSHCRTRQSNSLDFVHRVFFCFHFSHQLWLLFEEYWLSKNDKKRCRNSNYREWWIDANKGIRVFGYNCLNKKWITLKTVWKSKIASYRDRRELFGLRMHR